MCDIWVLGASQLASDGTSTFLSFASMHGAVQALHLRREKQVLLFRCDFPCCTGLLADKHVAGSCSRCLATPGLFWAGMSVCPWFL